MTPQVPISSSGQKYKDRIEILLFVHMGLAIAQMICIGFGTSIGDWVACLILFLGLNQHNFCNLYIYMILCLISMFKITFLFLYALQLGVPFTNVAKVTGLANTIWFIVTFHLAMLCFYCAAVGMSFRAYREYKGMYEDSNAGGKSFMTPFEYGSVKESNL